MSNTILSLKKIAILNHLLYIYKNAKNMFSKPNDQPAITKGWISYDFKQLKRKWIIVPHVGKGTEFKDSL